MPGSTDVKDQERLAALDRYDVLDTPQEEAFDRITRLACRFFDVPISTITMIDGHRSWFKSQEGGSPGCEAPKASAFCTVTIKEAAPFVVLDTLVDERFRDNLFVVGQPHIRFYAGVPLRTPDGNNIGTLCLYTLGLKLSRRYQSLNDYDLALRRHESAVRRPAD